MRTGRKMYASKRITAHTLSRRSARARVHTRHCRYVHTSHAGQPPAAFRIIFPIELVAFTFNPSQHTTPSSPEQSRRQRHRPRAQTTQIRFIYRAASFRPGQTAGPFRLHARPGYLPPVTTTGSIHGAIRPIHPPAIYARTRPTHPPHRTSTHLVNPSSSAPSPTNQRKQFAALDRSPRSHSTSIRHHEGVPDGLLPPARWRRGPGGGGGRRRGDHGHGQGHGAAEAVGQETQEEGDAAGAERDGAAALPLLRRPVPHARLVRDARLHRRRAAGRHPQLLRQPLHRGGRVRAGLQGLPRRQGGAGDAAAARGRQVPGRRGAPGPPRVARRGRLPRHAAQPPAPRQARRILLPGAPPHARLRVHGPRQPRAPPLQESAGELAVGDEAEDRGGGGQGAGVPARGGDAGHLPGLQGLQHPARIGLHGEAVGLRAGEGGPVGGRHARVHAGDGHARLRGAGVHPHGPPHGEERRVQLRGGAAGAAHGPPERRQAPPRPRAEPRRLGAPLPAAAGQAAPRHGPQPRGQLLRRGRRQGRHGGVQLPAQRAQEPPHHARGRRLARAAHAHVRRRARRAVRLHGAVAGGQGRRGQGRQGRRGRRGGQGRQRWRGGGGGQEEVPALGRARRERGAQVRELGGGEGEPRLAEAEEGQRGVRNNACVCSCVREIFFCPNCAKCT